MDTKLLNKIRYSKILPFKSFVALTLFGYIWIREEYKEEFEEALSNNEFWALKLLNHEAIHLAQEKELHYTFWLLYFIEWIFRLIMPPYDSAYQDISFEIEASKHEADLDYIETRKKFSWLKYLTFNNR